MQPNTTSYGPTRYNALITLPRLQSACLAGMLGGIWQPFGSRTAKSGFYRKMRHHAHTRRRAASAKSCAGTPGIGIESLPRAVRSHAKQAWADPCQLGPQGNANLQRAARATRRPYGRGRSRGLAQFAGGMRQSRPWAGQPCVRLRTSRPAGRGHLRRSAALQAAGLGDSGARKALARMQPYFRPAAARSSRALSVASQVNSGSSRPKWP